MPLRGANTLKRQVRNIRDNLGDEVSDEVRDSSEQIAREAQGNVVSQNAVWRTNLYRSIRVIEVPFADGDRYYIQANTPYAAYVEFGTGKRGSGTADGRFQFAAPAFTPDLTREITEWVMTKPGFYAPRTRSVAWAIAKSISKHGTHPHPFMRPAWFTGKPMLVDNAERAVGRVIRRA